MTQNKTPVQKGESLMVRKAVAVLRLFGEGAEPLGLNDVVRATGYSKTVCHRLLATLVSERFLIQSEKNSRYAMGPDLTALLQSEGRHAGLLIASDDIMAEMARETGDVITLYVAEGINAVCIARHDGDYNVRATGVHVGGRLPIHCGGGPMALLSFSSQKLREQLLNAPLARPTPQTETDPDRLRALIEQVRERGYAVGDEDLFEYVVAVGAPIFRDQLLVGSLSVGGIKPRYDAQRIKEVAQIILKAVHDIEARLKGPRMDP